MNNQTNSLIILLENNHKKIEKKKKLMYPLDLILLTIVQIKKYWIKKLSIINQKKNLI